MSSWSRALDDLVRERGAALFGYAYVLTGNAADAEDLVQSALVRTFRTGQATRGIDSTHAYVKSAIASALVDGHRRSRARPQRAPGAAGDVDASLASAVVADHAPAVDASLDLHQAILLLPPRERACVVLRYLEDKPVAGIAAELGLATGSVKRYLSDAVKTLRDTTDIDFTAKPAVPVVNRTGGTP